MTLEQLTAERDQLRAEVRRLREALVEADGVMWMAHAYAESGGQNGPEMRDFREAEVAIGCALANIPHAEGGVAPKAKEGA